jgi:hypothetical protein
MRPSASLLCFLALPLALAGCSLTDATNAINILSVKFSEGSPAVTGQTVTYSGGLTDAPTLDKFRFKMTFHVKADNSANDYKAGFGSSALKPILSFRINSKSATPVTTTIEPFTVEAKTISSLDFPIEIPIASLDKAMVKKIINGDPIPYFLSGTIKFDLLDGTTNKGSGTSDLDLASGEISTRPSGSVTALLSGLL